MTLHITFAIHIDVVYINVRPIIFGIAFYIRISCHDCNFGLTKYRQMRKRFFNSCFNPMIKNVKLKRGDNIKNCKRLKNVKLK